jgi:Tfp pilus assembly protein PilO
MQWTRNNWVALVAFCVLSGAYVIFVHVPLTSRLNDLRAEVSRTEAKIAEDKVSADRIEPLRREVDESRRQFKDFDRRLPRQQELGEFLREISNTAQEQHLESQRIQPGSPTRDKLYNRMPIILNFNGSFTDVVGFLEGLGKLTRLTRIERIEMKPTGEGQNLQVEMQVNIYFTES